MSPVPVTLKVTSAVYSLSNSHTLGNASCNNSNGMFTHQSESAHGL